ncbi:unnamed protein product, partial [Durusdinium trenchii]
MREPLNSYLVLASRSIYDYFRKGGETLPRDFEEKNRLTRQLSWTLPEASPTTVERVKPSKARRLSSCKSEDATVKTEFRFLPLFWFLGMDDKPAQRVYFNLELARVRQIKFTAPHPLNLVASYLLIDLRQSGYVEIYGPNTQNVYGHLQDWLEKHWHAKSIPADPHFCDRKFKCTAFRKRGSEGENNMGLCATKLVDFLNKVCHWKMIACNASNFGRFGDQREQQIAIRYDDFKHKDCVHVLVELRDVGYIEVSGLEDASSTVAKAVHEFITHQWHCSEYRNNIFEAFSAKYCDRKYRTPPNFYLREGLRNTLGRRTIELATFMSAQGWELAACNGGSLYLPKQKQRSGDGLVRENQIKFVGDGTVGSTPLTARPLLLVEFRTLPGCDAMGRAFLESFIEITGFDTNGIYATLSEFVQNHMQSRLVSKATPFCDLCFACEAFQMKEATLKCKEGRFLGESNFGKYAMRLCDFMVDYLGEWELLVCNNNCLSVSLQGQPSLAREAQMVFRFRDRSRDVFVSSGQASLLRRPPMMAPGYWTEPGKAGMVAQEVVPASSEELVMLQEVLDGTYKAKRTRDRLGQPVPSRLVVVAALRSETPELWDRYARRRQRLEQELKGEKDLVTPVTLAASLGLTLRCIHEDRGNASNEAYLLHGSNPTSAMSILGTSFKMDLAGKNAGSMFGPGIYMAESSVKADEYARDDTSGSYAGLFAVLFCRALVGRSLQVTDPADYGPLVTNGDFHSVVGDRERAVGTFREFVFFHEESIYPEFAVFYRRELFWETPRTEQSLGSVIGVIGLSDHFSKQKAAAQQDREAAAEEVIQFWFEELTVDDWFRQSHVLDDRIRQQFGALHGRAAAGELAGVSSGYAGLPNAPALRDSYKFWVAESFFDKDTCLALVVILDQFSRCLYRGSASAYTCDSAARAAANTAILRGDDKRRGSRGPYRRHGHRPAEDVAAGPQALGVLFAFYALRRLAGRDDRVTGKTVMGRTQDKARCVHLMREGSQSPRDEKALPKLTASISGAGTDRNPESGGQERKAKTPKASSVTVEKADDRKVDEESLVPKPEVTRVTRRVPEAVHGPSIERGEAVADRGWGRWRLGRRAWTDLLSEEESDFSDEEEVQIFKANRASSHRHGRKTYSMQAALEISALPVLPLNHAHAQRFREMRLDAQMQQVAFLESCEALSKDSAALASASSTLARTLGDEAAWREAVLERARCAGAEELRFEGTWRRTFLCIHQREAGCSATTLQWSCRCGVLWSCAPRKRADPKVLKKVRNWIEGVSAWVCPEQPCHFQEVQLGHFFAGWPGAWTPWRLRKTFGPRRFRVALPGAGEVYRMELDHFLRYAFESSISDSQPPRWDAEPLYLFDPKPPLALRPLRQPQLSTQLDLARERGCPVAEALRKLVRGWLLIGGPGSGSRFHVDAFGTGAWSATLCGAKRWALYPPGRRPPGLLDMGPGRFAAPAPIFWFSEVLPQLKSHERPMELVTKA